MKQKLLILAGLIALSIALRVFSFFPSVINHDESTYLVIGDALLSGNTYWVDYFDTKPFGIFGITAGVQWVFGKSIFFFRLFSACCLALTAFGLFLLQRFWGNSLRVGIASGVMYLIMNSIFTFYGVSPNTETFFNLFTIYAAILVFWPNKKSVMLYGLAGILLGIGFLVKYVVAFDALALGLFLLLDCWRGRLVFWDFFRKGFLMVAGFFIPFVLLYSFYANIGETDSFLFHSFTVSSRYPNSPRVFHLLKFLADFLLRFLPITVFFVAALLHKNIPTRLKQFGMLWGICSLTAVMAPGIAFGHYFIQFMLPFSFVAGWTFGIKKIELPSYLKWLFRPQIGYSILGVLLSVNLFFQKMDFFDKTDDPRIVADYLAEQLKPGDQIYTGNYSHILYYLLDRKSPTRYVHPSLFWSAQHIAAMDIDIDQEIQLIKAAAPRFVLMRKEFPDERFEELLRQGEYQVVKIFPFKGLKVLEKRFQ